jgi:cellulose synthase/poly-beta-1,6-N-acetylglucosamine synthase-like glycosyltransferase
MIVRRDWLKQEITPSVSVIISAYNEEAVIDQKVRNALALDYPEDHLEVIVSSDGSTDRTNKIVSEIQDHRLTLFAFPERVGKTACLNKVIQKAKGEIVLFTDANSMFTSDLLLNVVRNFADQDIGLVTGWTRYHKPGGSEETTSLYSKFEKWTKIRESSVSSCVGADGAVFAIRKELYRILQEYDINDFVIPLDVIRQKKRVVMDPEVFCFEEPTHEAGAEYQRQVRITARTLGAIHRNLDFLNPFRFGVFAYFLFSHKIMRFLVPFFLIGTFLTNLLLLTTSWFYALTLLGQIVVGLLGVASTTPFGKGKLASIAGFFLLTVAAQLVGWLKVLSGASFTVWNPRH